MARGREEGGVVVGAGGLGTGMGFVVAPPPVARAVRQAAQTSVGHDERGARGADWLVMVWWWQQGTG